MPLSFVGEVLGMAGYAMLFAAVYKLFQIGTQLGEIKDLLRAQHRSQEVSGPAAPAASAHDGADDYARSLLRSLKQDV